MTFVHINGRLFVKNDIKKCYKILFTESQILNYINHTVKVSCLLSLFFF